MTSAPLLFVVKKFDPFFIIGSYKLSIFFKTSLLLEPTTILSGYLKSRIASPSRRNSGLEITSKYFFFTFFDIIFSTSSPVVTGTVDLFTIILKRKNKKLFEVVSNPEFLREGEAIRDFRYPDRIVVGSNNRKVTKKLESLYEPLIKKGSIFFSTNRRGAEMIKYASNAFLATKISYINEIANFCEKAGVNVEDVSLGMGLDKRIGSRFLRAGPAYGGSCFPKDTKAITVSADLFKVNLSIIKSVINSNSNRRMLLIKRIDKILSNKIKNKKITILGVTFKPNTDDMRESTSLIMIPYLNKKGAKVTYYDPSGEKNQFKRLRNVLFSTDLNESCLKADLVIIHTEWDEFKSIDFKKISKNKNLMIYDLRNLYSPQKMKKIGINYHSIGR